MDCEEWKLNSPRMRAYLRRINKVLYAELGSTRDSDYIAALFVFAGVELSHKPSIEDSEIISVVRYGERMGRLRDGQPREK